MREVLPLHTVTATETATQAIGLPGPYSGTQTYQNSTLRIQYQGAALTASSGSLQFTTKLSYDNGASWVSGPSGSAITLSTTAQAGEQTLTITPNAPTDVGHVLLMVLANFGGSPTNPTVTYRTDLVEDTRLSLTLN